MNRIKTVINGFAVCILVGSSVNDGFAVSNTRENVSSPRFPVTKQNGNSISGFVFDASRQPVADIYIELQDDVGSTLGRVRTSGSGRYSFSGLSSGNFNVKTIIPDRDLIEQTQRIQIVNLNNSGRIYGYENVQLDFRLLSSKKESVETRNTPARVVFAQEVPKSAQKLYELGLSEIKLNKFDSAVTNIKSALDIFPSYFEALETLGVENVKRNKYDAALPYLVKAVEVNQKSFECLYALGVTHYILKNSKEAESVLQKATTVNGQSSGANFYYGMLLRQTGKLVDAETYLNKAKTLAKSPDPQIYWQLALLYKQTRRFKKSADELQLFLKAQPDSRDKEMITKLIEQLRSMKEG